MPSFPLSPTLWNHNHSFTLFVRMPVLHRRNKLVGRRTKRPKRTLAAGWVFRAAIPRDRFFPMGRFFSSDHRRVATADAVARLRQRWRQMTGETGRQTDTRSMLYAMDVVSDNDNDRRVNLSHLLSRLYHAAFEETCSSHQPTNQPFYGHYTGQTALRTRGFCWCKW